MVWYFHLSKSFPRFVMIQTVKGFSVFDETEIDIFLKFPCFLYNPANIGDKLSTKDSTKKQRHHFANKGSYSQSYGFSNSHVWM